MEKIPVRSINTIANKPDSSDSFIIRDVRDLLAGKDMVEQLHRHDFFFMLALKKGRGHHEIDFIPYKVGNNTVFFLRPGQVHQLTLKAGSEGFLVQLGRNFYHSHDKLFNQLLRKAGSRNFYQPDANRFKKVQAALTNAFREYRDRQERYQEVVKANLDIILIELVRQQSNSAPDNNANPHIQERLEELLALVETHMATHKQVSQYAEMLHLSSYQLNAITKAALGKTCSELINEYIILESKRHLLATAGQVKEIAWYLGYEDISYFIRFFKKHTGYSPESFRHHFR